MYPGVFRSGECRSEASLRASSSPWRGIDLLPVILVMEIKASLTASVRATGLKKYIPTLGWLPAILDGTWTPPPVRRVG